MSLALSCYQQAIRLAPTADLCSNTGNVYKELGCVSEAMACYNAAAALQPGHAVAIGNLGSCLLDIGDVDRAIETLQARGRAGLSKNAILSCE